ncbi:MAG: Gfo/Idh/MocA family oxidoreductase [Candidatus Margulisiibacteriota bacterium]
MQKKIKTAVIGLGNMGINHVRKYLQIDQAQLAAVSDVDKSLIEKLKTEYPDLKYYQDYQEMLDQAKPDAVNIVVPTKYHYEVAKAAIVKKIHVLIEKPMADSVAEAESLIQLAKENQVVLMVGHVERFNPVVKKIKELLVSGKLGEIITIQGQRVSPMPAQIKDTNVLMDLAIHDIDLFNYFFDKLPNKIIKHASSFVLADRADHVEIFLDYGKSSGFIKANWLTPIRIRGVSITGTKGYLESNYLTQKIWFYQGQVDLNKASRDAVLSEAEEIMVNQEESLKNELIHFINAIINKIEPLTSGQAALDALKLVQTEE